mmetsp:Transcript_70966/g.208278  ORF Transcript_70966/g.208278 Transcript_70966/m.208278 type:complete len:165 (-) Transcript_70966:51-545(-)
MGPRTAMPRGRPGVACLAALATAMSAAVYMQRCFMVPSAPQLSMAPASARRVEESGVFGGAALTSGDVEVLSGNVLTDAARSLMNVRTLISPRDVSMANKKRGRKDKSEGWTNRKKYRQCSTIARAATVKGRKIMKRRMLRGKKKHLNTGDYVNPKMMPVRKLR